MKKKAWTVADYLILDAEHPASMEFLLGQIYPRSSSESDLIASNFRNALRQKIGDRSIQIFDSQRVRISGTDHYCYPELAIVFGEPEFDSDDNLLNPNILVEVVFETTEKQDRGIKPSLYRQISSVRQVLLMAWDRPHTQSLELRSEGGWFVRDYTLGSELLSLPSLGITLPQSAIFKDHDKRVVQPAALQSTLGKGVENVEKERLQLSWVIVLLYSIPIAMLTSKMCYETSKGLSVWLSVLSVGLVILASVAYLALAWYIRSRNRCDILIVYMTGGVFFAMQNLTAFGKHADASVDRVGLLNVAHLSSYLLLYFSFGIGAKLAQLPQAGRVRSGNE
jgi:Uma2 family endonuclease